MNENLVINHQQLQQEVNQFYNVQKQEKQLHHFVSKRRPIVEEGESDVQFIVKPLRFLQSSQNNFNFQHYSSQTSVAIKKSVRFKQDKNQRLTMSLTNAKKNQSGKKQNNNIHKEIRSVKKNKQKSTSSQNIYLLLKQRLKSYLFRATYQKMKLLRNNDNVFEFLVQATSIAENIQLPALLIQKTFKKANLAQLTMKSKQMLKQIQMAVQVCFQFFERAQILNKNLLQAKDCKEKQILLQVLDELRDFTKQCKDQSIFLGNPKPDLNGNMTVYSRKKRTNLSYTPLPKPLFSINYIQRNVQKSVLTKAKSSSVWASTMYLVKKIAKK